MEGGGKQLREWIFTWSVLFLITIAALSILDVAAEHMTVEFEVSHLIIKFLQNCMKQQFVDL